MRKIALFLLLISCQIGSPKGGAIKPAVRTTSVKGDADACAIWISPEDHTQSTIIGNDKTRNGALYVWDLTSGQLVYTTPAMNQPVNPSVRQRVTFNDEVLDIVGCALRSDNTVTLFSIDLKTRRLKPFASNISTGFDAESYGFTLYHRPDDGHLFAFVSQKKKGADIHQIELFPDGTGKLIRSFGGGDQRSFVEGMVVDDEMGFLYCADERGGVLKYHADPRRGDDELISRFAETDGIVGDREGLALYILPNETGYLVLSSQGDSTVKVYTRDTNVYVKTVVTEEAENTDGVAATSVPIGLRFPEGALVCHDGKKNRFVIYSWKELDIRGHNESRDSDALPSL